MRYNNTTIPKLALGLVFVGSMSCSDLQTKSNVDTRNSSISADAKSVLSNIQNERGLASGCNDFLDGNKEASAQVTNTANQEQPLCSILVEGDFDYLLLVSASQKSQSEIKSLEEELSSYAGELVLKLVVIMPEDYRTQAPTIGDDSLLYNDFRGDLQGLYGLGDRSSAVVLGRQSAAAVTEFSGLEDLVGAITKSASSNDGSSSGDSFSFPDIFSIWDGRNNLGDSNWDVSPL